MKLTDDGDVTESFFGGWPDQALGHLDDRGVRHDATTQSISLQADFQGNVPE
jgi:hypothetical protein